MHRYVAIVETVVPEPIAPAVIADPDDDHVLACAVAAVADVIVSGDTDLLDLAMYQGIPIVTAVEAVTRLSNRQ